METNKSGCDTFTKTMNCLILFYVQSAKILILALCGEEKSFWAIKTFVFCSTAVLHCDNKRDFQPKEHNL